MSTLSGYVRKIVVSPTSKKDADFGNQVLQITMVVDKHTTHEQIERLTEAVNSEPVQVSIV